MFNVNNESGFFVLLLFKTSQAEGTESKVYPETYYSMYEWLSNPIRHIDSQSKVDLVAYFAADKRLYVNKIDYETYNKEASLLVDYSESMSGCIDNYVTVWATVGFSENHNDMIVTKIKRFSKKILRSDRPVSKNMEDELKIVNFHFNPNNCEDSLN